MTAASRGPCGQRSRRWYSAPIMSVAERLAQDAGYVLLRLNGHHPFSSRPPALEPDLEGQLDRMVDRIAALEGAPITSVRRRLRTMAEGSLKSQRAVDRLAAARANAGRTQKQDGRRSLHGTSR
jgi:hypothetical protein